MKSIKIGILIAALTICGIAKADHTQYVGVDAHLKSTSIKGSDKSSFAKHGLGGNIHTGVRFDDKWGIEAGFHLHKKRKALGVIKTRSMHISLNGIMPISEENGLDLIGGIGISHLKFNGLHPDVKAFDSSKILPRLMGGIELKLCDSIKFRTSLVYDIPLTTKSKAYKPNGNYGITAGFVFLL